MKWYIGCNKNGDLALGKDNINPQFCLCRRYFPARPDEKMWFGELIKEVVSVDGSLFPEEEQTVLTEKQAESIIVEEGSQILRVFCMLDENGSLDDPHIAEQNAEGFDFCGFDLADNWVSALLNCGSFTAGDYFSEAFDYRELNELGLIPDYESAVKIRQELMEKYPDDDHAYCAVFAIWRRIM